MMLCTKTELLLAALLWGTFVSSSSAADYHVAPLGNDTTGNGTAASPWREIRKALTVVLPGDTILVADGQYKGFTVSNLGTTGSTITIKALGTNAEILPTTDRGATYDPDNIAIWYSTNIVVDGFRSFGATRAAVRVVYSNRITIRNGVYGNNATWAVVTTHSDDAVVEHCDLYGSATQHGIYFANSGDRPVARGNRIHNNFGSGIRAYGDATQDGDGIISGALFENNIIHDNNGGGAMNLNAFFDAVIRNNLIYNNHASSGIALFGGAGSIGVGNISVYNNTIDMPTDGKYCLRILDNEGPITVRDNILHNRNNLKGIYSWGTSVDAENTDGDYNIVGGALHVSDDNESTRKTWANWQAAGHEPQSSTSEPAALFVDDASADYHLRPGAPAIDAGDPDFAAAPGEMDLDGHSRVINGRVDIGADELSCGNWLLDPGETCDDGDLVDCDGCDSNCSPSSMCGNRLVCGPEECDDGNTAEGDCCSATCRLETAGSVCDDRDPCTIEDACNGSGTCVGTETPAPACLIPTQSGKSVLIIKSSSLDARNSFRWKWKKGQQTMFADLGSPPGSATYTLCMYDEASGTSRVAFRAVVPGGGASRGRPLWTDSGARRLKYRERDGIADGIGSMSLLAGTDGRATIDLRGKGVHLALPRTIAQDPSVAVQLKNNAGACWGAQYGAPAIANGAGVFRDTSN